MVLKPKIFFRKMNKFSFAISYNVVYKQYRDILKNSEIDSAEKNKFLCLKFLNNMVYYS